MTRLADRNPEGEDPKGLRAEHESGGAAEQQAPNSLFLQPNIDHAVGGGLEALNIAGQLDKLSSSHRPLLTAAAKCLRSLTASPLSPRVRALVIAAREVAYAEPTREGLDALDKAVEQFSADIPWADEPTLSAPQQPVKLDAVREALDDLQQAEAEYRLMHDRHGDGSQAAGRAWDLMRRAGNKARDALATPPLDNTGLDADVAELVLRIGGAEWGATDPLSAEEHAAHVANSVRITASASGQEGPQAMHGLYVKGTETVICHAGTSPNSPDIARALAGAWNHLRTLAIASGDRS